MAVPYPHLLAPLKVGNILLKNRMESANSMPHFLQGPEPFPAESLITHFAHRARSGAAIVTISGVNDMPGECMFGPEHDMAHFPHFNIYDAQCQNYMLHLTDVIHYYDSLVSVGLFSANKKFPYFDENGEMTMIDVAENDKSNIVGFDVLRDYVTDAIPKETLEKVAASFGQQAALLKKLGVDMVTLHMSYGGQFAGQFLSPNFNFRTDEFNGPIQNRAKFPLMVMKSIRDAVGPDFPIEVQVTGEEPEGTTLAETIEFLRMAQEYIDIVQVRGYNGDDCSPTGFAASRTPYLHCAEEIKRAGLNLLVAGVGGWNDPEEAEKALAEGRVDLISMARAWISNPDFGKMVYEGRREDIVPCIRCNKCHGRGPGDPFVTVCSVNPLCGIQHEVDMLTTKPGEAKNVAVVGGGPAGMRTALYLTERGHTVTIFEQEGTLGGLIRHADLVDFKWPLRDYKDYLIAHVMKDPAITVKLNTKATPELLGDAYDVVISATGSSPVRPRIPGADGANVCFAVDALMNSEKVGQNVVVIGGGEVGVETGMYLAKQGKNVTVLEMRPELAADSTLIHYRAVFKAAWEKIPTFHAIVNAAAAEITEDRVFYCDEEGELRDIPADTVILSVGMKANLDEALTFQNAGKRFFMVGDCRKPGTIEKCNRSAYAVASQI